MKKALFEAIKEPLRLLVLAIIPFAITYFTQIDSQWAIYATLILRFLDKALHEVGKDNSTVKDESIFLKGITRF